jgi:flagellar hook-associated protein 1 FlgK
MGTSLNSIGVRAMFAAQQALQATSANIANANTPGYSRQSVVLSTSGGQYTGAGFVPKGVQVETIMRAHNAFLTREAQLSTALSAADVARRDQLSRLESVFPTGENGIGAAAGELLNSFVDVANNPGDTAARQVVLANADEYALRLRSAAGKLGELQRGVIDDVRNSVSMINTYAQRVAQLNSQIAATQGTGHEPNDMLDQRDQVIKDLSGYVQVTTVPSDDGSLSLFIAGGQNLVLGGRAAALRATTDPYDATRVGISVSDPGGTRPLSADSLAGGALAGLMRFQNDDLVDARNLIGQMAAALGERLNEQQSLGLDLGNPPGSGAPIFHVGGPRVLPASTNTRDASGAFVSQPTLTVTDASQLQASDYDLRLDPANAGQYLLTRLSDGNVRSVVDGANVDGFTLSLGANAPTGSETFLLQPVGVAADSMRRVLDDPKGIAAASPLSATVGSTNTGTGSVQSLRVTSTAVDATATANISFNSNTGTYDWELRDTSNAVISSGAATWTAGQPIVLNGFELRLNGVPRSGDTFQVGPTLYPRSDNGNALALIDLRDEGLVGRQVLSDGSVVAGDTITSAYGQAMADIGVRVQGATAAAEVSAAVLKDADSALQSKVGVNLDEEAARLIQYQQSYQAAAKVLQIAQSVFQTLLDTAGR